MDISIYKNKLLNEGFLNIKLDELYPDLVDTIQIFNNKEEYIQRLSNIQFDSIIFSDITYEYIKSLYCSNSDLINEERINIKEIEGNSSFLTKRNKFQRCYFHLIMRKAKEVHQ